MNLTNGTEKLTEKKEVLRPTVTGKVLSWFLFTHHAWNLTCFPAAYWRDSVCESAGCQRVSRAKNAHFSSNLEGRKSVAFETIITRTTKGSIFSIQHVSFTWKSCLMFKECLCYLINTQHNLLYQQVPFKMHPSTCSRLLLCTYEMYGMRRVEGREWNLQKETAFEQREDVL